MPNVFSPSSDNVLDPTDSPRETVAEPTRRGVLAKLSAFFGYLALGSSLLEACQPSPQPSPSHGIETKSSVKSAPPGFPTIEELIRVLEQGKFFAPPAETPTHRFADYWEALDRARGLGAWPLRPMTEISEVPIKKLDLVVHPLYHLFIHGFQPALWQACRNQRGIQDYVPAYL